MSLRIGGVALFLALTTSLSAGAQSVSDRTMALSPDGTQSVRESKRANGIILELVDLASGNARPLVRLPGENHWPVWSPDGLFVAFCAEFQDRYFVTVTDMTGHSWMVQEIRGGLTRISWSPDAVWLVYGAEAAPGNRDLFLASAGGTDVRNLTQTASISEDQPLWSSTSGRINFQYSSMDAATPKHAWLSPPEVRR